MSAPDLSIVICTHNRVDYLKLVLDALHAQCEVLDELEIIVVDNASSDGTAELCSGHAITRAPVVFSYVYEPSIGLSQARNTGVEVSRGGIVAFLDDDAIPDPGWAASLRSAFLGERVGAAGGEVVLAYEVRRPDWLTDVLELYLTRVDWGSEPRAIDLVSEWVAGANIAFRRSLLQQHPFDTSLGRKGASLISGEETQLCRRIAQDGWTTAWVPAARVVHHIPAARATKAYLRRRAYAGGYSAVLVDRRLGESQDRIRTFVRGAKTVITGCLRLCDPRRSSAEHAEASVLAYSGAGTAVAAIVGWRLGERRTSA